MKLLLVEDEAKIVDFIVKGLKGESFVVDVASDGEEGFFKATSTEYDVIILDLMLPKKDGYALCQELRERNINTPILMLTAKDALSDKVKGFSLGADDYLTKPFAFEELVARLRALSRRKYGREENILKIADLEINLDAHEVKRGGKLLDLTPREFNLLQYLINNKGQALTRTQILQNVWEFDFDSGTNVVDVYIRYLRNKVDKGRKKKLIQTVRSVGYRIQE